MFLAPWIFIFFIAFLLVSRVASAYSIPNKIKIIKESGITVRSTISSSSEKARSVLRERRERMMRATTFSLPGGNANDGIRVGAIDTALGIDDKTHSFGRNAIREVLHQSIVQNPEETCGAHNIDVLS